MELSKGEKSEAMAKKFKAALLAKLEDFTGGVSQLGHSIEIKIVDIDVATNKAEVLTAVRAVIFGAKNDEIAVSQRDAVYITGLWEVKSG